MQTNPSKYNQSKPTDLFIFLLLFLLCSHHSSQHQMPPHTPTVLIRIVWQTGYFFHSLLHITQSKKKKNPAQVCHINLHGYKYTQRYYWKQTNKNQDETVFSTTKQSKCKVESWFTGTTVPIEFTQSKWQVIEITEVCSFLAHISLH